jgi:hypothetical protein
VKTLHLFRKLCAWRLLYSHNLRSIPATELSEPNITLYTRRLQYHMMYCKRNVKIRHKITLRVSGKLIGSNILWVPSVFYSRDLYECSQFLNVIVKKWPQYFTFLQYIYNRNVTFQINGDASSPYYFPALLEQYLDKNTHVLKSP